MLVAAFKFTRAAQGLKINFFGSLWTAVP